MSKSCLFWQFNVWPNNLWLNCFIMYFNLFSEDCSDCDLWIWVKKPEEYEPSHVKKYGWPSLTIIQWATTIVKLPILPNAQFRESFHVSWLPAGLLCWVIPSYLWMGPIFGVSLEILKRFLLVFLLAPLHVQNIADIEGCPNTVHVQESCLW